MAIIYSHSSGHHKVLGTGNNKCIITLTISEVTANGGTDTVILSGSGGIYSGTLGGRILEITNFSCDAAGSVSGTIKYKNHDGQGHDDTGTFAGTQGL